MKRVGELHQHLEAGDVLVADRGFCSFAHLATLQKRGIHTVMRLHQRRRADFKPRRRSWANCKWPQRLGHDDQLNVWHKTGVPSRVMSREAYDALPDTMILREVRYCVKRKGYRSRKITLVTTLLDAAVYPVGALAELYHRRWQAEINLRHLKDTLDMRVLRSQSVAGVARELLAFALIYNLICAVMTIIALHLETTPERVSLIDVLRLLRHGLANVPPAIATITLNPDRPGRHQPRVVKRRPLGYSRMTRPRAELKRELMKNSSP
jgi:hypothetical protein